MGRDSKDEGRFVGIALLTVTVLLYAPVINQDFVRFDDGSYVQNNPLVNRGLSWQSVKQALHSLHAGTSYWHPITWISHQIDVEVFGLEAGWHKLTNVVFHCYNTLLLYTLLRRFPQSALASAIVAALFAWHPLHVESVVWVSERKDVLSTFFAFLTLHLYIDYAEKRTLKRYLFLVIGFACALMSKPMVVTLPFLMGLLDYWPLRRESADTMPQVSIQRLFWEKMPLLTMSVCVAVITVIAQRDLGIVPSTGDLSISYRVANALESYGVYAKKTVIPTGLAVHYPYPEAFSPRAVLTALVFFVVMTAVAIRSWRSRPYFMFGWAWYVISLLPVIGLIQTSTQARADRYTYLPLVGLFIIIVWGLNQWVTRHRKLIFGCLLAMAFAVHVPLTWRQIGYWTNSEALFRRAVSVTKSNAKMRVALANILSWQNQTPEVLLHFNRAMDIAPASGRVHASVAGYYGSMRDLRREMIHLRLSLLWAPKQASLLNRLAYILATHPNQAVRDGEEATELSRRACTIDGYKTALYRHTLAAAMAEAGDFQRAIRISQEALKDDAGPHNAWFGDRLTLYQAGLPYRDPDFLQIDHRPKP